MKKQLANIITGFRILCSIILIFLPTFSVQFYIAYLVCGLSDMADGTVARRTNSTSSFGSKLDTAADIIFTAVTMAKLLPRLHLPTWLLMWVAVIALIKLTNIAFGLVRRIGLVSVHSVMNKVTGLLLFLLPLTLSLVELEYSSTVVCSAATFAALQEMYYLCTGRS